MELPILFFAFLPFLFMLIKFLKNSTNDNSSLKLPPGPRPLPIIGNMHNLFGSLIHHRLRDLAKSYGPLMHLRIGEVTTLVVSSPELAEEFMGTHDIIFANRPQLLCPRVFNYGCTDIAFAPYGEYWRQLRKICVVELLSSNRVLSLRPVREEEVLGFVKAIRGSEVNLSKELCSFSYDLTTRVAFGKKSKYQEQFISLIVEAAKMSSGFAMADVYPSVKFIQVLSEMSPKFRRMQRLLDRCLNNILDDHKVEKSQEDLVDVLLNVQKSGDFPIPLTTNNIKAVILDIFSAGSETASTALEWAMSEMVRNPEVMKKAQEEVRKVFDATGNVREWSIHELRYLQAVLKETLRLHPPVPMLIPRESSEQCSIHGFEIPAKTRVIINAWAIGRDPQYWADAETFNPERFMNCCIDYQGKDFKYIPFGAGRRMCPGISLGLASVQLILAQLLFHFDWKLAGGRKSEELDMTEVFGLSVRRKNDLNLIPVLYRNSCLVEGYRSR